MEAVVETFPEMLGRLLLPRVEIATLRIPV